MAGLLQGRGLLLLAALLLAGCAEPESRPAEPLATFDDETWRNAGKAFAKAYQEWAAREALESPPAVRMDRLLNVTNADLYVTQAENLIMNEIAIAGIQVAPKEPGEREDDVYDLRVEVTQDTAGDDSAQSQTTRVYLKLFDPNGGVVVSKAHVERRVREAEAKDGY